MTWNIQSYKEFSDRKKAEEEKKNEQSKPSNRVKDYIDTDIDNAYTRWKKYHEESKPLDRVDDHFDTSNSYLKWKKYHEESAPLKKTNDGFLDVETAYLRWKSRPEGEDPYFKAYSVGEKVKKEKKPEDDDIESITKKIDDLKNEANNYFITINRLKKDNIDLKQRIENLLKENKKLNESLKFIENNPEEYKRRKELDPFNEEEWDN